MEYAYVTGYSSDSVNLFSTLASAGNEVMDTLDGSEPVSVVQNTYKKTIEIKEIIMDCLQGTEILPINDKDYKNKDVDEIISKMDEFSETFHRLQNELDELHKLYNHEYKSTQENIAKLDTTIHYMKVMNEEYDKDETITEIMDKMNFYAGKIKENDKLKVAKDNYTTKRKELNSYLYFIQNLNKWNISAICPICITDKIDSYCNPCGHTACKKCLVRNSSIVDNVNHNKCPICREYVMDIRKLYFI
tara:strand:+ start:499 stop:1239 length:741 start_codon:yes stop_codon:yes gene_type:complete